MARVYDKQRQTVTNTETGSTSYYGAKVTGLKHSKAFYEDIRTKAGTCTTCQRACAVHSDAEIDNCIDKFMRAQKGS